MSSVSGSGAQSFSCVPTELKHQVSKCWEDDLGQRDLFVVAVCTSSRELDIVQPISIFPLHSA